MNKAHTPAEVAANIKDLIKQKYGSLNVYAQEKNMTLDQLCAMLNDKKYPPLLPSLNFSADFEISMDYCTNGSLPIFNPDRDYMLLLDVATAFYEAVTKEDKLREEYERIYDSLSSEEHARCKAFLHKLRIDKIKAGRELVDLLNKGWDEDDSEEDIEKPIIPKNTMKLHEAIQAVLRESGHAMTFTEIARQINKQNLYIRKDEKPVPASQISARVKNYPHLFDVNDTSPKTLTLKNNTL